jgi:hypothetical protein
VESKLFIHSLCWYWLCFINIDDLPSLVGTTMLLMNNHSSSFFILVGLNIKDSEISVVDKELVVVLEELPPVGVGAPDLEVTCSS